MSDDYKPILEGVLKQEDLNGREPLEIVKEELLKNGYPVSDINNYDVIFSGVDDQDTRYEVHMKDDTNDLELKDNLKEIEDLRNSIEYSNKSDQEKLLDLAFQKIDKLEKEIKDKTNINDYLLTEIKSVDTALDKVKSVIQEYVKKFNELEDEMKKIVASQKEAFENLEHLSEEDINKLKNDFRDKKKERNKSSVSVLKMINLEKGKIKSLQRKKNHLKNDLLKAEALGLNVDEYLNINKTLRSRKLMNSILENKGLKDIISKKSEERSAEEKNLLKDAKEEILLEVTNLYKKNNDSSIEKIIDALYNVDTSLKKENESRKLPLSVNDIKEVRNKKKALVERVVGNKKKTNYKPSKAPLDMKDVSIASFANNANKEYREKLLSDAAKKKNSVSVDKKSDQLNIPSFANNEYLRKHSNDKLVVSKKSLNNSLDKPIKNKTNLDATVDLNDVLNLLPKDVISDNKNENTNTVSVSSIAKKLTKGLVIYDKDVEHYTASNVWASREFTEELEKNDYSYNLITMVKETAKVSGKILKKLGNNLLTSNRCREAMSEVKNRFNSLDDFEKDALLNSYLDGSLSNNLPFSIDVLLNSSIVNYSLEKMDKEVSYCYQDLVPCIGQIQACEQILTHEKLSENEKNAFLREYQVLNNRASSSISMIFENRKKAYKIFDKEKDNSLVKKYTTVGYYYDKDKNCDDQVSLDRYSRTLDKKIENNDSQGIVDYFFLVEALYSKEFYKPNEKYEYLCGVLGLKNNEDVNQGLSVMTVSEAICRDINVHSLRSAKLQNLLDDNNVTMKDLDLSKWKYNNLINHDNNKFVNPFMEDVNTTMNYEFLQLQAGKEDTNKFLTDMDNIVEQSNKKTIDVFKNSMNLLNEYSKTDSKYPISDVEEILVDLSSSDLIDDLVKNYPNPSKWNKYLKEKAEGFQAIPTEILLAVFNSRITDSYTNIVSSYMKNELDKSNDIKK
ncbi:MAG: hypothetical protein IJ842_03275 [Bacilli bacterium]|nr:hypothetical protein [Bacilli bacterium]